MTNEQLHRAEVSKLMKDLNRACKMADNYNKANESRKEQITLWNKFFQKLLAEGRITKAELKEYSPRKPKQS